MTLLRFMVWLYMTTGLYGLWSRMYRFLWECGYDDAITTFSTVKQLGEFLTVRREMWRADSWRQMFDAVSRPERVERIFCGLEEPVHGLDCDEFAIWTGAALRRSRLLGVMTEDVSNIAMLTVTWRDVTGLLGHNACLFRYKGSWVFVDYGMPRGHSDTIEGTVKLLLAEYAEKDAELITWSLHDVTKLRHIETHRGFSS